MNRNTHFEIKFLTLKFESLLFFNISIFYCQVRKQPIMTQISKQLQPYIIFNDQPRESSSKKKWQGEEDPKMLRFCKVSGRQNIITIIHVGVTYIINQYLNHQKCIVTLLYLHLKESIFITSRDNKFMLFKFCFKFLEKKCQFLN